MQVKEYDHAYTYTYNYNNGRFARGVRGHAPPPPPPRKFFFKWCNLVRSGVHLGQIWSLIFFLIYHFLNKNFKNTTFLYKKINFSDTSDEKKFENILRLMRFGVYF